MSMTIERMRPHTHLKLVRRGRQEYNPQSWYLAMSRFLISAVYRDDKGQMQETALGIVHSDKVHNAAASARLKYPLPSHVARKTQPFPEKPAQEARDYWRRQSSEPEQEMGSAPVRRGQPGHPDNDMGM